MERIGIRELRQHASAWVRRAEAGETLEVTDRGRPVARLTPLPPSPAGVRALETAGLISRGHRELQDLEPVAAKPNTRSISEELTSLRARER